MCNDAYLPDPEEERSDEEYAMYMFELYSQEQQRAEQQADLPPHKRDDYAERVEDAADMHRQQMKDDRMIEALERKSA